MTLCVLCMQEEGDPLSGGYCAGCRPMDVKVGRQQLGPEALTARSIAKTFGTRAKEKK